MDKMDCPQAFALLQSYALGDRSPVITVFRQPAADHVISCGCETCIGAKLFLYGDKPYVVRLDEDEKDGLDLGRFSAVECDPADAGE